MNIAWWPERAADEYRDNVALVDGRRGTSWTYTELRDSAEAVAAEVPRTMPKRTKDLRALVGGIQIGTDGPVRAVTVLTTKGPP